MYLHVPFCVHRCDYCAFATWDDKDDLVEPYLAALRAEVARAVDAGLPAADTVFVGGGTPSMVSASRLASVLDAVPRRTGAEVTVEVNPESVTPALLEGYLDIGVSRVSLGVQSLVPATLASLGRRHEPATAIAAARAVADAGFASWNVDLIYGAAGERLEDWQASLDGVLELDPPHVSAYALTVEAGTPLASHPDRHPDDDDQADKYGLAEEVLTAAGLAWYEISNWARPGHACRHNLVYWHQQDYAGFGCAAHGHRAGRRHWNIRSIERYIDAVQAGRSPEAGAEVLDAHARAEEALQLGLRLRTGVPAPALPPEALGADDSRLLVRSAGRVHLTLEGRLLANEVAMHLTVPAASPAAR